jgi:hypothetical protein
MYHIPPPLMLLIMQSPATSSLYTQMSSHSTVFLNTLSLCFSFNMRDQVSHPYQTTCNIVFPYIRTFTCSCSRWEDRRLWSKCQ